MTRAFCVWLGSLLAIVIFTLICVYWLDRPTATFVHDTVGRVILGGVADSKISSLPLLSAVIFVACGLAAVLGRQFSTVETTALLCDVSTLAAETIKNELKFVFGRTWPDSWTPGIHSFIRDNAYGFHFFQSDRSYESFPSGHAAFVAAILSVVWLLYPKLRGLCLICIAVADVGLVALNVHFISDVVAGTFVGISSGLFTVAAWQMTRRMPAEAAFKQGAK